jgi:hypothetical protein
MRRAPRFLILPFFLLLAASAAQGEVQTFYLDFSSDSGDYQYVSLTGHSLRVYGTLTIDPDLPIGSSVQASELYLQHAGDPARLISGPPIYYGSEAALEWNVVGDELYINRLTTNAMGASGRAGMVWALGPPTGGLLRFGGGQFQDHALFIDNDSSHVDRLTLKGASEPDGPQGFLVGTRVPEPTSVIIIGLACAACRVRSWISNTAAGKRRK